VGTKNYDCWNKSILMGKNNGWRNKNIGCGDKTYDW
jgi:hypothetical protein